MIRSMSKAVVAAFWCAAVSGTFVSAAGADPISYQGRVTDGGSAPDGSYDINFQVFNAGVGGSPVGPALQRTAVLSSADNGLFSFDDLDFGDGVFTGEPRWIEVSVRQSGAGGFTTLSPRQAVRATPYAQFAQNANVSLNDAFLNGSVISNQGLDPLVIRGLTQIGLAQTNTGFMQFFMNSSASPVLQFGSVPGFGGQTRWFDELGTTIGLFEGDPQGVGLAMRLSGDGGVFEWDADLGAGTNSGSRFFITGPVSGMSFNNTLSGDESLQLPADAVGSQEIFDEPGLASDAVDQGITLGVNFAPIMSRSISVPAPGNVIVLASGAISVTRQSGANGLMVLGISESASTLPDTQQNVLQIPPIGVAGAYNWPMSTHAVFEAPVAGTYTYYFNGNSQGFTNPRIFDPRLTLLYVPTSYGDVTPTLLAADGGYSADAPVRAALTPAEILEEQLREQSRALKAMQAEQAAMRAQLDALRAAAAANEAERERIQSEQDARSPARSLSGD